MAVDLHAHSTASDGSDPPRVLIQRAADIGLTAVALGLLARFWHLTSKPIVPS